MRLDIHSLFSAKYAKWIIIALISLFSILIITTYLSLLWPSGSTAEQTIDNGPPKRVAAKGTDFIQSSALFGVYVPDNLNEGNVKKSMLDVTLVGILLGNKVADSQIILRSAGGNEKTYSLGDEIPGGAKIKRIMAGGILVERNGSLESLSLPKNDLIFEPAAKPLSEEE